MGSRRATSAGNGAPVTPSAFVSLCHSSELLEGSAKGFERLQVFALCYHAQIHVWRDLCPHHGTTPLAWRRDAYLNADASRIVCAAHGAQFEPDTGLCTLGPCLGESLTRVPTRMNADGDIDIELNTI